jgi:hypothetical protein
MIGGAAVVVILIVCIIICSRRHHKKRESFQQEMTPGPNFANCRVGGQQITCPAYPSNVDPQAYGIGTNWDFTPKSQEDKHDAQSLVRKWFAFEAAVSPEIAGAIYSFFPDLQTVQSIQLYGLTAGMVAVLKLISPNLNSPQTVKTYDDVKRLFLKTALEVANREMNEKPMSGLYSNPSQYDGSINVW